MKACRLRASICHTQCHSYAFRSIAQDRSYIHEGLRGCRWHDWRSRGRLAIDDEANTSQVGESGRRRHCQSCSNLVERLMRAGERGFVVLVHGVGLVVPSFARAVLHGEHQRQGRWRWCIPHSDVWIGLHCSDCGWRLLHSCCACLFSRSKSKMCVGRGERRTGAPIMSHFHMCVMTAESGLALENPW